MKTDLFDFELSDSLIAQEPSAKRDDSRLMVVNRQTGNIEHHCFRDLIRFLDAGDVLVFNDSRVIPARLIGTKRVTNATVELLVAHPLGGYNFDSSRWISLARPARRLKPGDMIDFSNDLSAEIINKNDDGTIEVFFHSSGNLLDAIQKIGLTPLPPYIRRNTDQHDANRYQTVYAKESGSVAAPTAGLHFTEELIGQCAEKGVHTTNITLHVGIGTFRSVQTDTINEHRMHTEWYRINQATADLLGKAHRDGRRVVCVGTTSLRALESSVTVSADGELAIKSGWMSTDIFIYPGYRFLIADALITNFHLPKSTLLMLISAFYNREAVLAAYEVAMSQNYRFFSYGDAMLII